VTKQSQTLFASDLPLINHRLALTWPLVGHWQGSKKRQKSGKNPNRLPNPDPESPATPVPLFVFWSCKIRTRCTGVDYPPVRANRKLVRIIAGFEIEAGTSLQNLNGPPPKKKPQAEKNLTFLPGPSRPQPAPARSQPGL